METKVCPVCYDKPGQIFVFDFKSAFKWPISKTVNFFWRALMCVVLYFDRNLILSSPAHFLSLSLTSVVRFVQTRQATQRKADTEA